MAALAQPSISTVANDSHEVRPLPEKKNAFKSQSSHKWNIRCPKYKMVKISEKGAIFMIIWNLFYTVYYRVVFNNSPGKEYYLH